jgi:hypothetical protein
MFFIAGVQPRIQTMDQQPRRCSRCGLLEVYLQRVDHYFSLFFIPLLPVKKGEPYLYCRQCRLPAEPHGWTDRTATQATCSRCGRPLKSDYSFCPFCGLPR